MGIFAFLKGVVTGISDAAFLYGCFSAVFSAFAICFFLSLFKNGYGLKKRVWFCFFSAAIVALSKFRAEASAENGYASLIAFFVFFLFIPVCCLPEKNKNDRSAPRDFVRCLEEKIKNSEPEFEENAPEPEILTAKPVLHEKEVSVKSGLDFSHVKNVLKRLDFSLLSYADRRQIHELELALYQSEHGEETEQTKSKINEGLGNLLKIMARHGV